MTCRPNGNPSCNNQPTVLTICTNKLRYVRQQFLLNNNNWFKELFTVLNNCCLIPFINFCLLHFTNFVFCLILSAASSLLRTFVSSLILNCVSYLLQSFHPSILLTFYSYLSLTSAFSLCEPLSPPFYSFLSLHYYCWLLLLAHF